MTTDKTHQGVLSAVADEAFPQGQEILASLRSDAPDLEIMHYFMGLGVILGKVAPGQMMIDISDGEKGDDCALIVSSFTQPKDGVYGSLRAREWTFSDDYDQGGAGTLQLRRVSMLSAPIEKNLPKEKKRVDLPGITMETTQISGDTRTIMTDIYETVLELLPQQFHPKLVDYLDAETKRKAAAAAAPAPDGTAPG